ncbi:MAG: C4-type zinc ribbon domain-containing protein [Dehalococcoidia bacterium]|nr:C4-type zinc ribbon domain-containing protein [Dehalococcoidia bacterium]
MSLPGQLYKLQQIDIELQKNQQIVAETIRQLNEDSALVTAESELTTQKQQLVEAKKKQKSAEWELEDLQERINHLNNKLYDGTVKNPKELLNIEHEAESLKGRLSTKEDELLELMSQVEEMETKVKTGTKEFQQLKQEWQQKQENLNRGKVEVDTVLTNLNENRRDLAQQISPEALNLYEQIKLTKGQAVAKVEQGRCQGCRITLPISRWQKARAGDLVQCNNCQRILYLE